MIPKAIPMEIRHIVFLLVFFILYVIFGGIIFMLLERPDEQIKRKEIETLLNDFTVHIKQLNNTKFSEQQFRLLIHELLLAKDENLIDNYGNQQPFINWSFINSFFFAITVITTIGYGHLTPRTIMAKIFCIIYALFGIPITSLLIGSVADRFSKLYSPKKLPRGLKRRSAYQRQISHRFQMLKRGLISLVPWFFAFLVVPAWIFRYLEEWSFLDGFYYCFVTLSTIGFGDFVAGSFEQNYIWIYKTLIVFWIIFGLAYLSMILNFITNALRSRRISNVMNSLRVKINSNGNLVARMRRQNDLPLNVQYERQRSTPSMFTAMFNDHEKFLHNLQYNKRTGNSSTFLCDPSLYSYNKHRDRINLFNIFKLFKSRQQHQQKRRKCSKNKIQQRLMRPTSSLPELSECMVRTQQIATITIV